jgi:A/G-specific adenine glycosylase
LVSEVMAQQTQIGRVEERWPGFMAAFPTPAAMAAASPADVIRAWRGLGYNRRALNLHRAAVAIAAAGGSVPGEVEGLSALPGVGPYTARAVAAIAFGIPVGAVDVNVRRVLGRILAADPASTSRASLQAAADALVDPDQPGTWTHALMDIGATVCRPARPSCAACPAKPWCRAARELGDGGVGRRMAGGTRAIRPATRPSATRSRPTAVPFEQTTRWLRGRLVDRLRDAVPGEVLVLDGPLGAHSPEAVARALAGLARDGMVELDAAGRARLAGSPEPA